MTRFYFNYKFLTWPKFLDHPPEVVLKYAHERRTDVFILSCYCDEFSKYFLYVPPR